MPNEKQSNPKNLEKSSYTAETIAASIRNDLLYRIGLKLYFHNFFLLFLDIRQKNFYLSFYFLSFNQAAEVNYQRGKPATYMPHPNFLFFFDRN